MTTTMDQDNNIDSDDLIEKPTPAKRRGRAPKKATTKEKKTTKKVTTSTTTIKKKKENDTKKGYDKKRTLELAEKYPDTYWKYHADTDLNMIGTINESNQLESIPSNIGDQGAITSMTLSNNGFLLATFSTVGSIKIWDIENGFELIRKIRDKDEPNIDEFFCGHFVEDVPDIIIAGGKLKDRQRWSEDDGDNHILPCPLKIFSLETGKLLGKLEGHNEEILSIKAVQFNGDNYYISSSEDGHIIKWKMADDWTTLIESHRMVDELTCMAFTISFLPNTGNKYFMAACDEHLRLYDFETNQLLQTFENLYTSYCDCGKFIKWLDEPQYWESVKKEEEDNNKNNGQQYAWFITRGAELCDVSEGVSSKPNSCILHKLNYPTVDNEEFTLEEIKRYQHEEYHSNSWFVKVTSNGRYLLAPTIYGQIFVFNILTGQTTAILKEHQDIEVRDVIFHPYRPLIFSSGDDGIVKVYSYKEN
ncbi:unnamed protein product [Cunninghamella echinulata]